MGIICPPDWDRVNLFENLSDTMVSPVPPVVTSLAAVSRRPRVSMLQFIYYSSSTLDRFLCLKFSWHTVILSDRTLKKWALSSFVLWFIDLCKYCFTIFTFQVRSTLRWPEKVIPIWIMTTVQLLSMRKFKLWTWWHYSSKFKYEKLLSLNFK